MQNKQRVDQLQEGVRSLLTKDGYSFSEEDKALLEDVLVELEKMSNSQKKSNNLQITMQALNLVLKLCKFFGIDDYTGLF